MTIVLVMKIQTLNFKGHLFRETTENRKNGSNWRTTLRGSQISSISIVNFGPNSVCWERLLGDATEWSAHYLTEIHPDRVYRMPN